MAVVTDCLDMKLTVAQATFDVLVALLFFDGNSSDSCARRWRASA